jgi:hypothetical protein
MVPIDTPFVKAQWTACHHTTVRSSNTIDTTTTLTNSNTNSSSNKHKNIPYQMSCMHPAVTLASMQHVQITPNAMKEPTKLLPLSVFIIPEKLGVISRSLGLTAADAAIQSMNRAILETASPDRHRAYQQLPALTATGPINNCPAHAGRAASCS